MGIRGEKHKNYFFLMWETVKIMALLTAIMFLRKGIWTFLGSHSAQLLT